MYLWKHWRKWLLPDCKGKVGVYTAGNGTRLSSLPVNMAGWGQNTVSKTEDVQSDERENAAEVIYSSFRPLLIIIPPLSQTPFFYTVSTSRQARPTPPALWCVLTEPSNRQLKDNGGNPCLSSLLFSFSTSLSAAKNSFFQYKIQSSFSNPNNYFLSFNFDHVTEKLTNRNIDVLCLEM